jgi:hypothetical protein
MSIPKWKIELSFVFTVKLHRPIENMISSQERLDLHKLLRESDAVDNTETIRRVQHSGPLIESLRTMELLKRSHKELRETNPEEFFLLCTEKCKFYFTNYMDLFRRQLKDELNLAIMIRMIRFMELIEQNQTPQHEASVMVGKYLKELYVDSAIRHAEHLDEQNGDAVSAKEDREENNIGWKDYKMAYAK